MKAKYTKPQLCVEYFSLTQSVAMACAWNSQVDTGLGYPTHGEPSSCAWVEPAAGEKIWMSTPICDGDYPENLDGGNFCYNAPAGNVQVFAS